MPILSDAWSKIKKMIVILHVKHGWKCPDCKNIYSPKVVKCPKCTNKPKIKFKIDNGLTVINQHIDVATNRKYFK